MFHVANIPQTPCLLFTIYYVSTNMSMRDTSGQNCLAMISMKWDDLEHEKDVDAVME